MTCKFYVSLKCVHLRVYVVLFLDVLIDRKGVDDSPVEVPVSMIDEVVSFYCSCCVNC